MSFVGRKANNSALISYFLGKTVITEKEDGVQQTSAAPINMNTEAVINKGTEIDIGLRPCASIHVPIYFQYYHYYLMY